MTFSRNATDSALMSLVTSTDPAVSSISSNQAVAKLLATFMIDARPRREVLTSEDREKVAASMRRDVLGMYNALLNDDLRGLIAQTGSLCAEFETTQHEWDVHNSSVADNGTLILLINDTLPSLSFLVRPVRKALLQGCFSPSHVVDVAPGTTITTRLPVLDTMAKTGLRQRLLNWYKPYRPQDLQ